MPRLTALGFCGVDDSIHVDQLLLIVQSFPNVEFGVLFRPDKEGDPRYASQQWIEKLKRSIPIFAQATGLSPKLAAHLCGSRVNEILRGDTSFLDSTIVPIFGRVQINATAVNGVDTTQLGEKETINTLHSIMEKYPELEFILQRNEETSALCQGIETLLDSSKLPNVAMLCDESKGTGVLSSSWPAPPTNAAYKMGYAGGIGPDNVTDVLKSIASVNDGDFWIDMESSLRSTKNGVDVFDLDKCYTIIDSVCRLGLILKPTFLSSST